MNGSIIKKHMAFTLAEVLVTLAIIGVVAAITLPVVSTNVKKNIIEKRLVSVVSILNSAIRMSEVYNGGMSSWDLTVYQVSGDPSNTSSVSERLSFFNKYFKPYLKTINDDFSEAKTLKDLGYTKPWTKPTGDTKIDIDQNVYPIILNNGTVFIHRGVYGDYGGKKNYRWIALYVDLDGPKGNNVIGKDIFVFSIPLKSGLSLVTYGEYNGYNVATKEFVNMHTDEQIENFCRTGESPNDKDQGYYYCAYLIKKNSWKIPKDYPWL